MNSPVLYEIEALDHSALFKLIDLCRVHEVTYSLCLDKEETHYWMRFDNLDDYLKVACPKI